MSVEARASRTFRARLVAAVAVTVVVVAGIVAVIVRDGDSSDARPTAAQSWECLMASSTFNQGMPAGMAAYLLDQYLTRGGYPPRGQAFYEAGLEELRQRDPREPLGTEPFGPDCDGLDGDDLNQLPSAFDDEIAAEAIVRLDDGRFDEADLDEVVATLVLRPDHGRPIYARVEGDDAMVVVERPDGRRGAWAFSDADGDGDFVEVDSEGMRLPIYSAADGSAIAGVALFSSAGFAYASTNEPEAVSAALSSDGLYLPIFDVHDGVADLSDAWGVALECDRPFTITWMADNGALVDELTDTFYCSPVD